MQGSDKRPEIAKKELLYVIKAIKNGKSPRPDGLTSELFKLVEGDLVNTLTDLFNYIHFFHFIKKGKRKTAHWPSHHQSNGRYTLKVLLKVIHTKIHRKIDMDIGDTQIEFLNGLATREALCALNVMCQRCLDMVQKICTVYRN